MAIELTPAKLANIKQKAEAAENMCPSHWACESIKGFVLHDYVVSDGEIIARCGYPEIQAHIVAADPATVLALVEEIEQLWAMERRWHKLLANAKPGPECIGQGFEVKAIKLESEAGQ